MFTGIVESIGKVIKIDKKEFDLNLVILTKEIKNLNIGDSISVNGVCLTVREINNEIFHVSVAHETLKLTNLSNIQINDEVNLESSLTLNKPLGGHIVQGHIATKTEIIDINNAGDSIYLKFNKPNELENYIVKKGYITIDGMSLTICNEDKYSFEVMIIPHTLDVTIAKHYKIGTIINIEVDIFARYIEKLYVK